MSGLVIRGSDLDNIRGLLSPDVFNGFAERYAEDEKKANGESSEIWFIPNSPLNENVRQLKSAIERTADIGPLPEVQIENRAYLISALSHDCRCN